MELYKKYRPAALDDVVGQDVAVRTLKSMLKTGEIPQAILFSGPSGCGKTTLARILASDESIGCTGIDLIEVNSSSYRGVDSVREMTRQSASCPFSKSRVWILDEVHKLTSDAQHAALKLLEDTPRNTYLFLCTTEPEKLIRAIRTRCTDIAVSRIPPDSVKEIVNRVSRSEEFDVGDSVDDIVEAADGSARAALVILDRIRHLPREDWSQAIMEGRIDSEKVIDLCRALLNKKPWKVVAQILRGIDDDPEKVRWAVLGYAQAVLVKTSNAQAFFMIQSFCEPFFNTKKAGLVGSCFEVINGS